MKRDAFTIPLAFPGELIIDNFAGGGGTSTGLERAFGRPVDIAINHNAEALAMHAANHPHTRHLCESVWDVDPIEVTQNQPVGLVWLSPDCKHFSKAKGGKPVEKKIRGLAWVALRWIAKCKPRAIILENVEEFKTWGPLIVDADGSARPDPAKKGKTFDSFVRQIRAHGYRVEWEELRACDYGTPTIRKRFFMVARRDGLPIIARPPVTHAAPTSKLAQTGKLQPWRTAAECIDWSIPCPSIFERTRPLADATLRRIAKGIMRYMVDAEQPFIVPSDAVVSVPFMTEHANSSTQRLFSVEEPMRTQCAQVKGGHFALVSPTLVQTGYGEREGQTPRALDIGKPLGTVVGGAVKYALVSAFLAKHYTGVVGSDLNDSMGTITAVDHHSLVAANLVHMGHGEQSANGAKRWSHGVRDVGVPLNTVAASGMPAAVVTSNLVKLRNNCVGQEVAEPLGTVTTGGHFAEVRAFLLSYYSTDQDPKIGGPLPTATTKDRFGLVTIHGQDYQIVDIGLRMLTPRELFKAQGFPDSYIIGDDESQGLKLTKTAQVRMCGNSVCPPLAEALARANFAHEAAIYERAAA